MAENNSNRGVRFYAPILPINFPIIVILGPTATGKTAVSIKLARELNAEIVNFDSVQVYKRLDIGSAKPTMEEMQGIRHHLIDILDPDEHFDASLFAKTAGNIINSIIKRGKVAIMVGGTGMYLRAYLQGLSPCIPSDIALRGRLKEIINENGSECLYEYLSEIDPASANRIHPNDGYRIIRAIEVYELTGKSISDWFMKNPTEGSYNVNVFKIGLILPRNELYNKIEKRTDFMIKHGLIEEVKSLLDDGYSPEIKSLQTLGYREIISFLKGEISLETAISLIKRNTRRYAKRQITWFKAERGVKWFCSEALDFYPLWRYINEKRSLT